MSRSWHNLQGGPKAESPRMSHIAAYLEVFGYARSSSGGGERGRPRRGLRGARHEAWTGSRNGGAPAGAVACRCHDTRPPLVEAAVVLGLLQGTFEWLPVSSQGIIVVVHSLLFDGEIAEGIGYSLWLHIGTVPSVLVAFRKGDRADRWRGAVPAPQAVSAGGLPPRLHGGQRRGLGCRWSSI